MLVSVAELALFLLTGIFAGLSAGLLGIGGGLVSVPVLVFMLADKIPPTNIMQVATATSLGSMVFITGSASLQHFKKRAINRSLIQTLAPSLFLGGILGRYSANFFPAMVLSSVFFIVTCGISGSLILNQISPDYKCPAICPFSDNFCLCITTLLISLLASMLGLGGGLFLVPLLIRYQFSPAHAIGNAAFCSFLVACLGSCTAIWIGIKYDYAFAHCLGSLYIPALLCIAIGGVATAPLGALLAHIMDENRLKLIFAVFLLSVATLMLWRFF